MHRQKSLDLHVNLTLLRCQEFQVHYMITFLPPFLHGKYDMVYETIQFNKNSTEKIEKYVNLTFDIFQLLSVKKISLCLT